MNVRHGAASTATQRLRAVSAAISILATLSLSLPATPASAGTPVPTTRNDFHFPGTQPSTITDPLSVPSDCTFCHSNYGSPLLEPYRTWEGSMMAQAGRNPLMYAAMAIANQDAPAAGEMCIRCHMSKGWLEGRSTPEDASDTTAADRQGVQCSVCHRQVDPAGGPGAPPEDAAILAALTEPVTSTGGGQMVVDPVERIRGPFTLGYNPHNPKQTLVSPYHTSSELCGTCHNVLNPVFRRNLSGSYDVTAMDTPIDDPALAFHEQQTYLEWELSAYASAPIYAPQFAGNGNGIAGNYDVQSCQDCHMPGVTGKAAITGTTRDDMPVHDLVGANIFTPTIIPLHPVYGSEVNADILSEGLERSVRNLRRAATVSATLSSGTLNVHVVNETGHKLPTGYPDGRRMWLHVKAYDADDAVVFESGSYDLATAELHGYEAAPSDPDYDANLKVWQTHQGIDPAVAGLTGNVAGPSFHLALNSVREFDNRIPPRGFTNAAFEAVAAQPVGQAYADGQYWDDVSYPVGTSAVRVEVTLNYQSTSKEYIEFLRDENMTDTAGDILYDLWQQADMGPPVEMAQVVVESDAKVVLGCAKNVDKLQSKYFKSYLGDWSKCYGKESAEDGSCDKTATEAAVAEAATALRAKLGGSDDKKCAGLSPATIGLGSYCPVPCASIVLFAMSDVADCAICMAEAVADSALTSGYGVTPPALPATVTDGDALSCLKSIGGSAKKLASTWSSTLMKCEAANVSGKNDPALDCSTDPSGKITKAQQKSDDKIAGCSVFTGLAGCGSTGAAAAASQCVEDAIGAVVPAYPAVAYP